MKRCLRRRALLAVLPSVFCCCCCRVGSTLAFLLANSFNTRAGRDAYQYRHVHSQPLENPEPLHDVLLSAHLDTVDPILTNLLLTAARDNRYQANFFFGLDDVALALRGLQVWSYALRRGRLPTVSDFSSAAESMTETHSDAAIGDRSRSENDSARVQVWPQEPLYSRFIEVLAELQLPRFVLLHPETVNAVLLGMLRLSIEFAARTAGGDDGLSVDDDDNVDEEEEEVNSINDDSYSVDFSNNAEIVADELASQLSFQWGGLVNAVQSLDQLFGTDHGLLDAVVGAEDDDDDDDEDGDPASPSPFGFGLNDGVWSHSGWSMIPQLQRRLSDMPELRELVKALGKRPAAQGKDMEKFPPQVRAPRNALGVEIDPLNRDSVRGIAMTGSLSEMLPSEAVLLKGSSALRRLFLARKAEAKLLGYDISGYADVPTRPKKRRTYFKRLPSAPGGPIIICLDTSFSMTGDREVLAKAVVLECVKAAHKQQRDCTVVAFSSASNTLECDLLAADKSGILRLLDFLSFSFSGGSDVTGALKHAMAVLGTDTMKASDVLLISDGELQNPPVPKNVMEELDRLKEETGMEIHGLLVGKTESEPLERLCTKVYDFLERYDALSALIGRNSGRASSD